MRMQHDTVGSHTFNGVSTSYCRLRYDGPLPYAEHSCELTESQSVAKDLETPVSVRIPRTWQYAPLSRRPSTGVQRQMPSGSKKTRSEVPERVQEKAI